MGVGLDLPLEALDRARFSRDPRFDGRFVVAVLSTHIYCRPICPVPFASSIRYYATAVEAEAAGFRPCLRCRPEAAPGSPAWRGTSATVSRALRLIEEGALDRGSVTTLAARVGIGARHLNRLMTEQVGASPLAIAQTRRLHFAKLLLSDTAMSITDIALASGYGSVRRFNDAFKAGYKRAPSDIRRRSPLGTPTGSRCASPTARRSTGTAPWRSWPAKPSRGSSASPPAPMRAPCRAWMVRCLWRSATARSRTPSPCRCGAPVRADLSALAVTARRVFDLAADPARIACAFQDDALLGPLVRARPGLRLVGVWSGFEAMVRAILEDQPASDADGADAFRFITGRLVERFGARVEAEGSGLTRLFPRAEDLAFADLEAIGLGVARSETLRGVARAVLEGTLKPNDAPERVKRTLGDIPGFGGSRAQWVGLRGYDEPDAFPGDSLALAPCETLSAAWRPWRGYAFFHLLAAARDATASHASRPDRVRQAG